jgi:four helix bundle protein
MGNFRDLIVYKKAYKLAIDIFQISKRFPKEEVYSLTSQIRESFRSVCANLAEAYRRRKYPAHFVSKTTDADSENTETEIWLDFSLGCNYINTVEHKELMFQQQELGKMIGSMIQNPEKYCDKLSYNKPASKK